MQNVNDSYFDGYYKEIWRSIIPAELTSKEVDFMISYFKLKPGDKVLDMMCGYGRHAIGLARQGINVVAVDNLGVYVEEINSKARKENLPLNASSLDILKYTTGDIFDLVICMGNSLNFFEGKDIHHLLTNIHSQLNPNGHLLINTWSLAEIAIRSFAARSWSETNGVKHVCESRYLFHPTRIESDSIFLSDDGSVEKKQAIDYIFSVAEMETLLLTGGFSVSEIYSIPGKKKFTLGDPRAYIVASKV